MSDLVICDRFIFRELSAEINFIIPNILCWTISVEEDNIRLDPRIRQKYSSRKRNNRMRITLRQNFIFNFPKCLRSIKEHSLWHYNSRLAILVQTLANMLQKEHFRSIGLIGKFCWIISFSFPPKGGFTKITSNLSFSSMLRISFMSVFCFAILGSEIPCKIIFITPII